ncbi:MAG: hypothetical protein ACP5II_07720 [Infirmifilum sp.]|jgi:hypothetical protein|nr:hypothetical protein [Infirmifilum uzonense]
MLEESVCRYYRPTAKGSRCVFIGVSEWKALNNKYLQYCKAGGSGCPVLATITKKMSNNQARKGGGRVLLEEG